MLVLLLPPCFMFYYLLVITVSAFYFPHFASVIMLLSFSSLCSFGRSTILSPFSCCSRFFPNTHDQKYTSLLYKNKMSNSLPWKKFPFLWCSFPTLRNKSPYTTFTILLPKPPFLQHFYFSSIIHPWILLR